MKERLMNMRYTLAVMFTMLLSATTLISCGDDNDINYDEQVYYYVAFETTGGSSSELYNEMSLIKNTFYQELGLAATETSFMFEGTIEKCNSRVMSCCRSAEAKLSGKVWSVRHIFTVKNVNTKTIVYTFDTDKVD